MSSAEEKAFTVAVLDFIGGLLGVFVFSILLESFWNEETIVATTLVTRASKRVLLEIANFKELNDSHVDPVHSSENFESFIFTYIVLLYVLSILSCMHIVFAPILVYGILKKHQVFMKLWLVFKLTAIFLTTVVFIVFCFRFTYIMAVTYVIFAVVNVSFLCVTSTALVEIPTILETVIENFPIEYATSQDGILERLIDFIEEHGLKTEGLYRVPGNKAGVQMLLSKLNQNPYTSISALKLQVNTVASAVVELVSNRFSSPVIPTDKLGDVEKIAKIVDPLDRVKQMQAFLLHLPPANFVALRILFMHFAKVATMSRVNSMNSSNLAVCWWPSIFPVSFNDMIKFRSLEPFFKDLVKEMIEKSQDLFGRDDNMV